MIETPGFLWTVLFFLLAIGPLVFIHEMGHYLVARWCGVKSEVFSIGFGREIAGWTDRLGTRWKIGWMPLGGYVRFAGDMNPASQPDPAWLLLPADERAKTFQSKSLWQRTLIVLAGPLANFIAAFLILTGFALANGVSTTPPVVDRVEAGSAAQAAGFAVGDRIVTINGRSIEAFSDIYPLIQMRPGMPVTVTIERDGAKRVVALTPRLTEIKDEFGTVHRVGQIGIGPPPPVYAPVSLAEAPGVGLKKMAAILDWTITGLTQIVTGKRSATDLAGPVRMAQASGQMAALGWETFVGLVAIISINLGFINLLPVPMLDGGHLAFYAVEAVRRKPANPRAMEFAFRTGMVALLALMLFVTLNDLSSLGVWSRLTGNAG
jgi:regulator of sigma E protease